MKHRDIVIYIAAPYRAEQEYQVYHNIEAARTMAQDVWRLGATALCPHLNTAFFGGLVEDRCFLDGSAELLTRCDAAYFYPAWQRSAGCREEHTICEERAIPLLYSAAQVYQYIISRTEQEAAEAEDTADYGAALEEHDHSPETA